MYVGYNIVSMWSIYIPTVICNDRDIHIHRPINIHQHLPTFISYACEGTKIMKKILPSTLTFEWKLFFSPFC